MKNKLYFKLLIIVILSSFVLGIVSFCIYQKENNSTDLNNISTGNSQTIAILDTGFSSKLLKEIKSNIIKTFNVTSNSDNIDDELGHGTSLTSFLLGSNKMKLKGILPNVKVILIKITDNQGKSNFSYLLKGLNAAERFGATVINISLGGDISNKKVADKILQLTRKNINVVSAAGDYHDKDLLFPSNLKNVVSVSSLNQNYELSNFSNFNDNVICSFIGEKIDVISLIDSKPIKTNELYGTSYEAIYASAYIASIKDYCSKNNIYISNNKLLKILKKNDPYKIKKIETNIKVLLN